MREAGLAAFEKRKEAKSKIYSFEQKIIKFDKQLEKTFKSNKEARKQNPFNLI